MQMLILARSSMSLPVSLLLSLVLFCRLRPVFIPSWLPWLLAPLRRPSPSFASMSAMLSSTSPLTLAPTAPSRPSSTRAPIRCLTSTTPLLLHPARLPLSLAWLLFLRLPIHSLTVVLLLFCFATPAVLSPSAPSALSSGLPRAPTLVWFVVRVLLLSSLVVRPFRLFTPLWPLLTLFRLALCFPTASLPFSPQLLVALFSPMAPVFPFASTMAFSFYLAFPFLPLLLPLLSHLMPLHPPALPSLCLAAFCRSLPTLPMLA